MILIDVSIPALSLRCDIRTSETACASVLAAELADLIRRESGEENAPDTGFSLFSRDQGRVLLEDVPLFAQGITDGSQLILV